MLAGVVVLAVGCTEKRDAPLAASCEKLRPYMTEEEVAEVCHPVEPWSRQDGEACDDRAGAYMVPGGPEIDHLVWYTHESTDSWILLAENCRVFFDQRGRLLGFTYRASSGGPAVKDCWEHYDIYGHPPTPSATNGLRADGVHFHFAREGGRARASAYGGPIGGRPNSVAPRK